MSSIKEHLGKIEEEIFKLNQDGHITESDEFVAITDIEIAINSARKVFERTKNIDAENK